MKATIWMILLSINQAIGSSPPSYTVLRSSDKKLSNFLNNDLKKIMREKEPIYDPYLSNQHIIDYRNKIINFKGKFTDFNIQNLSHYIVKKLSVNYWLRRIIVDLSFPQIISSGIYDIDTRYLNRLYVGKGHYNLTVTNSLVSFIVSTNMFGDLKVKSVRLKMSLGKFDVSATNEFLSNQESKKWSENLSKIIPRMITDNYKAISSYLSKKLVVIINDQIKNHGMFG
ncbi:uncharacterized protein LOC123260665 [Cotesia glomerata]|uniref:uncharacterized protein LOC123260665 n=1 Tax=Cotesia glomerata TaxID=32391 RepID=UPI001D00BBF0|nr:uncharacterized protein LOC123260665 [Cotesia glomerata]